LRVRCASSIINHQQNLMRGIKTSDITPSNCLLSWRCGHYKIQPHNLKTIVITINIRLSVAS
jgi:hypothetical protein